MPSQPETSPPRLTLSLDMEKYLGQIDDWDMTEAQKREFIEAMWGLLITIAEVNLGISRVNEAKKACGQLKDNSPKAPLTAPDGVNFNDQDMIDLSFTPADESESSKEAQ